MTIQSLWLWAASSSDWQPCRGVETGQSLCSFSTQAILPFYDMTREMPYGAWSGCSLPLTGCQEMLFRERPARLTTSVGAFSLRFPTSMAVVWRMSGAQLWLFLPEPVYGAVSYEFFNPFLKNHLPSWCLMEASSQCLLPAMQINTWFNFF